MSETVPRELMILVERVVRPLPMPLIRQQRMRTEFLEHLEMIYAEELASDHDPSAALTRTRQRFGDPQVLTEELRRTIRRGERALHWFEQKTAESQAGYSLRVSASIMAVLAFEGICIGSVFMLGFGLPFEGWLTAMTVLLGFGAGVSFLFGLFLFCSLHLGAEWRRPAARRARMAMFAGPILALGPLCVAAGAAVSGSLQHVIRHPLGITGHLLVLSVIGAVMVALGIWLGAMLDRQRSYRHEWSALDLDAA